MNIFGELQRLSPSQNLAISVMRVLRAERRITAQTLEHDSAQTPPIAFVTVALLQEDLRRDVIRCTDCGISEFPPVRFPCRDCVFAAERQRDWVHCYAVPPCLWCAVGRVALE